MNRITRFFVNTINTIKKINAFSIFASTALCKVLVFIGGMIIVRVLNKTEYGSYTYIMNCYGMLMLLYDLGCSVATMQFCSENYANPSYFNDYFTYGYKMGILFSGITALLIAFSPFFYPFQQPEAAFLTASLCLMPFLVTTNAFLLVNLRVRLKNQRYSIINIVNTIVQYMVILPAACYFGVRGAVWSNYLISLIVLAASLVLSKGLLQYSWKEVGLTRKEKRSFLKLAFASQLNNGVDRFLVLLDVFLIGIFIAKEDVISSYKVASTIPSALSFIPSCVMVCVVPYFSRHCGEIAWVRGRYRRLVALSAIGNFAISVGGILLAPWMVTLIFGKQYADAVVCFRILMIGYFFSATLRVPISNILYTQRRVRDNLRITVFSGVANCVLDIVLILQMGSVGAAIATTSVHIINSALSVHYMRKYLKRQEMIV